ncbi:MAG: winged helix-turn-helix domain-containing protein [Myxococcales bacterium]|nr:winged helix-turn-helix domain-containing protein [Myxococcales bacterium]
MTLELRSCIVDLERRTVHRRDAENGTLTHREALLLAFLADRSGATVSRQSLLREVWGYDPAVVSRACDNAVRRLRAKIETDPGAPDHILTVHGEGYRFEPLRPSESTEPVGAPASQIWLGDVALDLARHVAIGADGEVELTVRECTILSTLLAAEGQVVSREDLFRAAWQQRLVRQRALTSAIHRIRRKLGVGSEAAERLVTVARGGFRLDRARRPTVPVPPDRFVGRIRVLRTLADLVAKEGCVTLVGFGGVGKTRLALQLVRSLDDQGRPGPRWFCELAAARSRRQIVQVVAAALEVRLGDEPVDQLGRVLCGRGTALLVLDNAEHVAAEVASLVERWCGLAPRLTILTTSRHRLDLRGERLCALPPLHDDEARELFEERARAVLPSFRVRPPQNAVLQRVLDLLDGLPLAIELAAARVVMLDLEELVTRLEQQLQVLSTVERDRPTRHLSLRATLAWSWSLLDPEERAAVGCLAVFRNDFALAAGEAVIEAEAGPLDVLQGLVQKSWVQRTDDGRFRLLRCIVEYAEELTERVRLDAAEHRHGAYFAAMGTDDALEALRREGGHDRLRALMRSLDDIVAACERAVARADPEQAVPTLRLAWSVLLLRGPFTRIWSLADGVRALRGLTEEALLRVERVRGHAASMLRKMEDACSIDTDNLARARRVGDVRFEAMILIALGGTHRWQGRRSEALATFTSALARARHAGDRRLEGLAYANLATASWQLGHADDSRAHLEAALVIHRELGNRISEGITLSNLGLWHSGRGDAIEAKLCQEAALTVQQQIGDRASMAHTRRRLAMLEIDAGRLDAALVHLRAARALERELGNREGEGRVRYQLGVLHLQTGDLDAARTEIEACLAIQRAVGNRRTEGNALVRLGQILAARGRSGDARLHIEMGLSHLRAMEERKDEGEALMALAQLHAEQGQRTAARRCWQDAQAVFTEVGASTSAAALDTEVATWETRWAQAG